MRIRRLDLRAKPITLRYGAATFLVVVAVVLRLMFLEAFGTRAPYITFYPAVTIAALLGGIGPGLIATLLSVLAADFLWLVPIGQLTLGDFGDRLSTAIFILSCIIVSGVCEALHRIRDRAYKAEAELRISAERSRVAGALRVSEERFRALTMASSDVVYRMSPDWSEMHGGPDFVADMKKPSRNWLQEYIHPDDQSHVKAAINEAIRTKSIFELEHRVLHVDGTWGWTFSRAIPLLDANGEIVEWFGAASDVTERKQAEREREITVEFLHLMNACAGTEQLVEMAARFFKAQSGCEALGVRLREGDDYPYYEARGFPEEFVRLESSLCEPCAGGQPERDGADNPILECMCGNVICGRFDPSKPFFTPAGSFWTNDTSRLLASTTDADRQAHTRNRCNSEGYESVALIALRVGENCLGLLQLNDRRTGVFSAQSIALWERLAGYLAVALAKSRADEALRQSNANQALMTEVLRVLNRGGDLHGLVADTLRLIRESAGFDAVGLRLREGEDCPYFEQSGFSGEFLQEENFLCARGGDGAIVRDAEGGTVLECTCGLVLCGQTDPSMPCFTEGGSFWTNVSTDLLALPREADPRTNPRNRCIHVGYQSVGLFPVRAGDEIIGLLQLNDRRAGRFSPDLIAFFEGLAQNMGLAFQRAVAEKALSQAKQEAERANAAKDQFLAVLSHELRTPLTPVLAAVSLMERKGGLPAGASQDLEVIRRNVALEARLIDDLLDLTRIVRGKLSLNLEPVNICTLIERAANTCRPDIEARRLEFELDLRDARLTVNGDTARLQQVFWNLLNNSVKFTSEGGCVGIRCYGENGNVTVEVKDSGMGIEPHVLPRIFDAFEQGESKITRRFGGLGLGLAITKRLVELHGGTVSAHSGGKGKGATFRVVLPLAADKEKEKEEEASPAPKPTSRRILLVEDHGDTAQMMRALLESSGHEVETAGDVAQARAALRKKTFDLLISDLGLPDGSGIELMREIRRNDDLLKGIALSGYGREEDVRMSKDAGFTEHLTKPIDFDVLVGAIERIAHS